MRRERRQNGDFYELVILVVKKNGALSEVDGCCTSVYIVSYQILFLSRYDMYVRTSYQNIIPGTKLLYVVPDTGTSYPVHHSRYL